MLIDARNGHNLWNLHQVKTFHRQLYILCPNYTPDMRVETSLFLDRLGQASKTRRGVWKYIIPSTCICVLLLLPLNFEVSDYNGC